LAQWPLGNSHYTWTSLQGVHQIDWGPLSKSRDELPSLKLFKENPQRLKYGNSLHNLVRDPMMRLLFVLIIFLIGFIEIIALSEKNADWLCQEVSVNCFSW
jgi:hypothetical protein